MFYNNALIGASGGGVSENLISRLAGTAIGSMTNGGGLDAAFDGTTSKIQSNCAQSGPSSKDPGEYSYIGKDWGSGVTKLLNRVKCYSSSDYGFLSGASTTPNMSFIVQGGPDDSYWVTLKSGSVTDTADSQCTIELTDLTITTAYRYHRVGFTHDSGPNEWQMFSQLEMWELV